MIDWNITVRKRKIRVMVVESEDGKEGISRVADGIPEDSTLPNSKLNSIEL